MNRFDIIKPVENHPEELCCTECWQRGIQWGEGGAVDTIVRTILADRSESHAADDIYDAMVFNEVFRHDFKKKLVKLVEEAVFNNTSEELTVSNKEQGAINE